jgi:hypothetical protein
LVLTRSTNSALVILRPPFDQSDSSSSPPSSSVTRSSRQVSASLLGGHLVLASDALLGDVDGHSFPGGLIVRTSRVPNVSPRTNWAKIPKVRY